MKNGDVFLKKFYIGILLLLMVPLVTCRESKQIDRDQPWSVRMARSVMSRNPEPWMIDFRNKPKWEYTQGLVLKSLLDVWQVTRDETVFKYVQSYYDQFIDSTGNIWLYKLSDYNIDRINPGKPLFDLYQTTHDPKYKAAVELLRSQMKTHPRTGEGGFWHKKVYPHQMWLDGLYMGTPFLAQYAVEFDEPGLFDDVTRQIVLMEKNARDSKTGLLYHGWDESREQRWADPETGTSAHFWGRGLGWYAMAIVDVLDFLPENHPDYPILLSILDRLSQAIVRVQDPRTGLWYQVLDQGDREGNYPESSASCMFVYALAKAVRKGHIDRKYMAAAQKGWAGILDHFIEVDSTGQVHIHQACAGAGLGGSPYRDGSYSYYIHEHIRSNDPKAVGPFIMASLEFEMTEKSHP
ncbi:glycoside hydrolase family 88 protein [bacterium]|nr:glycoside hydrolase family 88 protein [bacterium]